MEEQVVSGMCLLCLRCEESVIMKNIESELEKVDVLCRHFWFAPEIVQNQMICSGCWDQVKGFHTFYMEVERVHSAECIVMDSNDSNDEPEAQKISEIFLTDSENSPDDEAKSDIGQSLVSDLEIVLLTNGPADGDTSGKFCAEKTLEQYYLGTHAPGDLICDTFSQGRTQKVHRGGAESQTRVECMLCGKWLKNSDSLRKHILRHKSSSEPQICDICGKRAPNSLALQSHKTFVHRKEKSFKCTVCQKAFKRAFTLQEHMTIHTSDILYQCLYCPKSFNSSANMHAHRKGMHPVEWKKGRRQNHEDPSQTGC